RDQERCRFLDPLRTFPGCRTSIPFPTTSARQRAGAAVVSGATRARSQNRLVEGAAETKQRQSHGGEHEDRERRDIDLHVGEVSALERNAADDADEMGERQGLAYDLRPLRHAAEGEGKARQ